MINKRFNKGIEEIQKVGLTPLEKAAMLKRIALIQPVPAIFKAPVKSPWHTRASVFVNRYSTSVVAAALVAMISGGALSYAAERTLPGDLLYSFKTNLSEPLQKLFTFSEMGQVELSEEIVNKRLDEEEALAIEGKLDPVKQVEVRESIDTQMKGLDDSHKSRVQGHIDTRLRKIDDIVHPKAAVTEVKAKIVAPKIEAPKIMPAAASMKFQATLSASTTLPVVTPATSTPATSTVETIIHTQTNVNTGGGSQSSAPSTSSVSAPASTPAASVSNTVTNTVNSLLP